MEDHGSLFPLLDKESLKENIIPLATTALLGITAINVLSSTQGQDPLAEGAKHTALRKFLIAMPYSMFPASLAGLAAAMAAKRRQRLLGFASGFLLEELMSLIIMGGLVTFVRADVSASIVWPVTGAILLVLLIIWLMLCAYPKCLRVVCTCGRAQLNDNVGDNQQSCLRVLCTCGRAQLINNVGDNQQTCGTCGAATVNGRSSC